MWLLVVARDAVLACFISISEQKHAVAIAAAKPVTAFRALPVAENLVRLTTGAMNGNAGHEQTSKARIIHQFN